MRYCLILPIVLLSACAPRPERPAGEIPGPAPSTRGGLAVVAPESVGMRSDVGARLDSLLSDAIARGVAPGAAIAVGRNGRLVHLAGHGRLDTDPASGAVDPETIYDLASLTKVVGTTTAAMILEEEGALDLDRPLGDYLPALRGTGKEAITLRLLLLHRGGFESFAPLFHEHRGREAYLAQIASRPLRWEPDTRTEYSDWDLILMQLVIESLTGETLDTYLERRVFGPLGMKDTGFNPDATRKQRVAPTEIQEFRGGKVHGEVHDENAWAMGGVAGHAGLFSTARDLAIFAQMLLDGGEHPGGRLLRPETITGWTARQGSESTRALGWDTPSPNGSAGRYLSSRSFGHTGFTGTSLWIDPEARLFVILLTNRVNPSREGVGVARLRREVADAARSAITDAPLTEREPG
jgi:CubicO group peptidase (beta-lactamase class C family)